MDELIFNKLKEYSLIFNHLNPAQKNELLKHIISNKQNGRLNELDLSLILEKYPNLDNYDKPSGEESWDWFIHVPLGKYVYKSYKEAQQHKQQAAVEATRQHQHQQQQAASSRLAAPSSYKPKGAESSRTPFQVALSNMTVAKSSGVAAALSSKALQAALSNTAVVAELSSKALQAAHKSKGALKAAVVAASSRAAPSSRPEPSSRLAPPPSSSNKTKGAVKAAAARIFVPSINRMFEKNTNKSYSVPPPSGRGGSRRRRRTAHRKRKSHRKSKRVHHTRRKHTRRHRHSHRRHHRH